MQKAAQRSTRSQGCCTCSHSIQLGRYRDMPARQLATFCNTLYRTAGTVLRQGVTAAAGVLCSGKWLDALPLCAVGS
jgi:hypothetical protein